MEKADLLKIVKTTPTEISKMDAMIDVSNFQSIKNYKDHDSSFSRIFNVPNKDYLPIIAAFFVSGKEGVQDAMMKLLDERVIEIVDESTLPGKEDMLVNINEVDPQESCSVIAVPPAFVIHLSGEPHV